MSIPPHPLFSPVVSPPNPFSRTGCTPIQAGGDPRLTNRLGLTVREAIYRPETNRMVAMLDETLPEPALPHALAVLIAADRAAAETGDDGPFDANLVEAAPAAAAVVAILPKLPVELRAMVLAAADEDRLAPSPFVATVLYRQDRAPSFRDVMFDDKAIAVAVALDRIRALAANTIMSWNPKAKGEGEGGVRLTPHEAHVQLQLLTNTLVSAAVASDGVLGLLTDTSGAAASRRRKALAQAIATDLETTGYLGLLTVERLAEIADGL